jgi:hypothetical protein
MPNLPVGGTLSAIDQTLANLAEKSKKSIIKVAIRGYSGVIIFNYK